MDGFMAICRSDRVRTVKATEVLWTDDVAYEILVNPHSNDDLLLQALEHASEAVLERAARQACHVANLRANPPPPSPTTDMLHGVAKCHGDGSKCEWTRRLSKAANGDWLLAEAVVDWLHGR